MLTTYAILLVFSVTINASVGVYFFFTPLLAVCIKDSQRAICQKLDKLLEENPGIVRKFFRDELFTIVIFIYGLILLITSDVLRKPFLDAPPSVLIAFTIDAGQYFYKCLQDCLLRGKIPLFKINLLHHVVTIATYIIFISYRQNAISGVIGMLFEGSVVFFDLVTFLRALGVRKNDYFYICCVFIGFVFTILFRAVCPLVLLIVVHLKYSPLKMDYLPLGFFFMNIVFYSMVNGWLAKSSFESLRRRLFSRRIINELSRVQNRAAVQGIALEQSIGGELELNNLTEQTHRQGRASPRQPMTVIIPANENFRLAPPVSNVNMTGNNSRINNVITSRHEPTLPRFNVIVNETTSTTDDTDSISGAIFV